MGLIWCFLSLRARHKSLPVSMLALGHEYCVFTRLVSRFSQESSTPTIIYISLLYQPCYATSRKFDGDDDADSISGCSRFSLTPLRKTQFLPFQWVVWQAVYCFTRLSSFHKRRYYFRYYFIIERRAFISHIRLIIDADDLYSWPISFTPPPPRTRRHDDGASGAYRLPSQPP